VAYQLKIILSDTEPPIWRRFQIDPTITLERLHDFLAIVMGWEGWEHMHGFYTPGPPKRFRGRELSPIEEEDEARVRLADILKMPKEWIKYVYDFGDNWEHVILLEKVAEGPSSSQLPIVIAGERACPPEDVGGVGGYEQLLWARKHPEDPEAGERVEWFGADFDPEAFDIDAVNHRLQSEARSRKKRKRG
jgi:Plasmid pRiA4b ORF-3-like protein